MTNYARTWKQEQRRRINDNAFYWTSWALIALALGSVLAAVVWSW